MGSVGKDAVKTRQSLRELDNQGIVCLFFGAVSMAGGRVGSFERGGEPYLRTRGMIVSPSVIVGMVRHLRGSCIVNQLLSLEVAATPENKTKLIRRLPSMYKKARTKRRNPPQKRFSVSISLGCSSPFMRLAEHPTARRAWCKQCLPDR